MREHRARRAECRRLGMNGHRSDSARSVSRSPVDRARVVDRTGLAAASAIRNLHERARGQAVARLRRDPVTGLSVK